MRRGWLGSLGSGLFAAAVVAWLLAIGLASVGEGTEAILSGVFAATSTICAMVFYISRRADRLFMHGYHTGYHDGTHRDCPYPQECDVLDLAEERARRA